MSYGGTHNLLPHVKGAGQLILSPKASFFFFWEHKEELRVFVLSLKGENGAIEWLQHDTYPRQCLSAYNTLLQQLDNKGGLAQPSAKNN
jgi:hypothetical protein